MFRPIRLSSRYSHLLILMHALVEILEMRIAPAATTFIWDGRAGGLWMDPVNWVGDIAPTPGSALVFPASYPPAFDTKITNDFPVGTEFDSLTFTGDGVQEGVWVQGNGIALNAGIRTTGTASGLVGLPLKLGRFSAQYRPAPKLGGDTDAILDSLGYDSLTRSDLRKRGAFGAAVAIPTSGVAEN